MRSAKSFWNSYVNRSKKTRKKGIFGGEIKTLEEIKVLDERIKAHEEKEGMKADRDLEKKLKNL